MKKNNKRDTEEREIEGKRKSREEEGGGKKTLFPSRNHSTGNENKWKTKKGRRKKKADRLASSFYRRTKGEANNA